MLIWPVLALLLVLLFYKRDVTPPWNPVIQPPQPPQPPQLPPTEAARQAPRDTGAPTRPSASGFTGGFTPPPPVDLNDVFRRPR
jgi:hypothetical protein